MRSHTPPMNSSQLAVTTMCYCDFPLERALEGVATSGIRSVELCGSVGYCDHAAPDRLGPNAGTKVQRLLNQNGLTAVSLSAHADISTEHGLAEFTARLELAADIGIPIVITFSLLPEQTDPARTDRFKREIVRLADRAGDLHVRLCLETFGLGMNNAITCISLLQQLGHPNLAINYDPAAHAYCFGQTPPLAPEVEELSDYLAHVHLNNKASFGQNRWDFRAIDEGIIDWHPILGVLKHIEFCGPAAIEIGWETVPRAPEVVNAAVARCVRFVGVYFDGVDEPVENPKL